MHIPEITDIGSLNSNLSVSQKTIIKDQKESNQKINNLNYNQRKIQNSKANQINTNNNDINISQKSKSITTINNSDNSINFPSIQQKQNPPLNIQKLSNNIEKKNIFYQKSSEKLKILKNLNEKEKSLCSELTQIKSKKKILSNISYGNLKSNLVDYNIHTSELKKIKQIENNLLEKISDVEMQIQSTMHREKEKTKKSSKSEKIIEKIKLLQKESSLLSQKRFIDLEKSQLRLNQEILLQNEIEKNKKLNFLSFQRINEKKIIQKRHQKIEETMEKMRENIKNKIYPYETNEKSPKNYLFQKMENDFIAKENEFLNKIKSNKKGDIVSNLELKELNKKYNQMKSISRKRSIEFKKQLKKGWHSQSLLLPKYKSSLYKKMEESQEICEKNIMEEKLKKINLYNDKQKYGMFKIPLPQINQNLRKNIINRKFSISNLHGKQRVKYISNELKKVKHNNSTKNYPTEFKKILHKNNKINRKNNKNNKNIKKEKEKEKNIKIDYLKELKKNNSMSKTKIDWNKYLNSNEDKGMSIKNAKIQLQAIDEQIKMKNDLIRLNGGYEKNPDAGNDTTNLLIKSIKGKLAIIQTINKSI